MPKMVIRFGREIMYDDDSGPETSVSYDSEYTLGRDGQRYVKIKGVGEETTVRVDHIPQLLAWLAEVAELDGRID